MRLPMFLLVSLNSLLVMAIGLAFFLGGAYHGVYYRDRIFAFGLCATGIGFLFLGITEGFTDITPRGKILYRLGIIAFLVGLPIVIYGAISLASSEW